MRYRVSGLDAISKQIRPPLLIEADSADAARRHATAAGMEVNQVEPLRQFPWLVVVAGLLAVAALVVLLTLWKRTSLPDTHQLARRQRYAEEMLLAQQAWETNQLHSANERLASLEPAVGETDLRGFEWYYLKRLCQPELISIQGLTQVAFSQNGRRLVGVQNKEIRVWDTHEVRLIRSFPIPGDRLSSMSLSGDGGRLAAAGTKVVRVWDVATGKEIHASEGAGLVVLSSDGNRWAEAERGTVKVTDFSTGKVVITLNGLRQVVRLAFSADGKRLVTACEGDVIQIWDGANGKELLKLPGGPTVAFTNDGSRIAGNSDGGASVWEIEIEEATLRALAVGLIGWFASPQGQGPMLAIPALLNTTPGRTVVRLPEAANKPPQAIAFSPDGQHLATANPDGKVVVWDVSNGKALFDLKGHTQPVTQLSYLDGQRLLTATDNIVRGWDVGSNPEYRPVVSQFSGLLGRDYLYDWSVDPQRLAAVLTNQSSASSTSGGVFGSLTIADPTVSIWEAPYRNRKELFRTRTFRKALAMSRDGKRVAVALEDNNIHVLDVRGRVLFILTGHKANTTSLAFSPDGQQLASGSEDHSVRLWSLETGNELCSPCQHTGQVKAVSYSADGQKVYSVGTGDKGAELKVWNSQTGKQLSSITGPLGSGDRSAISSDGQRIASGNNTEVQIWDAQNGKVLHTLRGHKGGVERMAFSLDGQRLASSGKEDRTIIWDPIAGQKLFELKENTAAIAFSPDSRYLISTVFRVKSEKGDNFQGWTYEDHQTRLRDGSDFSAEARMAHWRSLANPSEKPKRESSGWEWVQRLEAMASAGNQDKAIQEIDQALQQHQEEPWFWQVRGHLYAQQQKWDKAAADFKQAVQKNRSDPGAWDGHLHSCLQVGDVAGYRQGCSELLALFDKGFPSGSDANRLAWLCVLAPNGVTQIERSVRLGEQAARSKKWNELDTLGVALYRAGQYKEAGIRLEEAIKIHGKGGAVGTWLFLAMARHRLGEKDEAKKCLATALASFEKELPKETWAWTKRLELQLHRHEAETLLQDTEPK